MISVSESSINLSLCCLMTNTVMIKLCCNDKIVPVISVSSDKKISIVTRKEEGIIVGIIHSISGCVEVRNSSVFSKLLLADEGDFLRTVGFAGDLFKVEQQLDSFNFVYFRTFEAISNA